MSPEEARALFLEHCQPGDRGTLERYGEKAAVAAILAATNQPGEFEGRGPHATNRVCAVCTAEVAVWPEVMCCHCQTMPWKLSATPMRPTLFDGSEALRDRIREIQHTTLSKPIKAVMADAIVALKRKPLRADDLQAAWDRVDSLPPIEFKPDEAYEILTALACAQVQA